MTTMPMTVQERLPMPLIQAARAPAGPGSGFNVNDFLRILKQRIFLIIFIFLFIGAATTGLTFYLRAHYPLWRASSAIQVEAPGIKMPMQLGGEMRVQSDVIDRFVNDQAVLLKDELLLGEVLQDAAVRATQWFNTQDRPLIELRDKLRIRQIPQTSYLEVSFSTHVPDDAPVIVNAVVARYLHRVTTSSQQELTEELASVRERVRLLEQDLERIRNERQRFQENQMGTVGLNAGINVITDTWRILADQVTRLESEKLQYQTAYENMTAVDASQIAISPQMIQMIQRDPQIAALQNQLLGLNQELQARQEEGLGPNHRALTDIQARIMVVESSLLELQRRREAEIRENEVNSAYTFYVNAAQAELQLRERLMEAESKQRDLDRNLAVYQSYDERLQERTEQLRQVTAYADQLNMVIAERGAVRVRQRVRAIKPLEPYFPNFKVMIPAGAMAGLMLGLGLALLLEFMDTSVKTTRDLIRHVHIPILGTVPDLDDEEIDLEKIELAVHLAPRSMIAEAFRTFRTNLLLSAPLDQQRLVLLTSAKPEEGKTAVSINLAAAIGQSGRRVLLVDANFHQPALRAHFPNLPAEGLSNILIGQRKLDDLIHHTELPNLDVLNSGPIPPNPAELLAGGYMGQFLKEVAERYEQVIIDGPPVLLLSDALVLAGSVDGVILVCRAKVSQRGTVLRAREQLEQVNSRILGAVLNAVQVARGGYYREQIRSYYDYQPAEVLAAESEARLSAKPDDEELDHESQG
ncbi:MAG: polysaccharide biosynthesis tyrosine autokinase [Phycisphaerales bacterium]|nr:polysaccharide biosynthesis tyrosine autokinase [Phycisphaerales bacterium]